MPINWSDVVTGIISAVLAGVILWWLKEIFEKYKKLNEYTKAVFAVATAAITGTLAAVIGYALFEKSTILSLVLIVYSSISVYLIVRIFYVTATAVGQIAEMVKQMTDKVAQGRCEDS